MRKVVVNSTPLIILCGIGRLDILRMVYQEISIPTAVFREVTAKDDSACAQLKTSGKWIHVEEIKDHSEKKMHKARMDNIGSSLLFLYFRTNEWEINIKYSKNKD